MILRFIICIVSVLFASIPAAQAEVRIKRLYRLDPEKQAIVAGPDATSPAPAWNGDGSTVSQFLVPVAGKTIVVVTYTASSVHTQRQMTTTLVQRGTGGPGYVSWNIISGYPEPEDTRYLFVSRPKNGPATANRLMMITRIEGLAVAEVSGMTLTPTTDKEELDRIVHEVTVYLHTGR